MSASVGNQYSLEDEKWKNGAFTKRWSKASLARVDYTGKGKITVNMVDFYLSERVKKRTSF